MMLGKTKRATCDAETWMIGYSSVRVSKVRM